MNHINNHQLAVIPTSSTANIFQPPTGLHGTAPLAGHRCLWWLKSHRFPKQIQAARFRRNVPFQNTPFTSLSHGCRLMLLSYVFNQSLQIQNLRAMWSFLGPRKLFFFFSISITHLGGAGQVWPAPLSTLAWHWHLSWPKSWAPKHQLHLCKFLKIHLGQDLHSGVPNLSQSLQNWISHRFKYGFITKKTSCKNILVWKLWLQEFQDFYHQRHPI